MALFIKDPLGTAGERGLNDILAREPFCVVEKQLVFFLTVLSIFLFSSHVRHKCDHVQGSIQPLDIRRSPTKTSLSWLVADGAEDILALGVEKAAGSRSARWRR